MLLTSCQTFAPFKASPALKKACPEFEFRQGKLMQQVIKLKAEYELCKQKHSALIQILE